MDTPVHSLSLSKLRERLRMLDMCWTTASDGLWPGSDCQRPGAVSQSIDTPIASAASSTGLSKAGKTANGKTRSTVRAEEY